MALKLTVASLDEVPEEHRALYVEKDGKYALPVEGAVEKARLDEFRDGNVALKKQIEELQAKFNGIDPEAARELLEQQKKQRNKELIEAGKVEELLAERVSSMRAEYENALKALHEEKSTLATTLEGLVIDNALRDAAVKNGVRPSAIEDVLLRGKRVFKLQEGQAVGMDGDRPLYGKDGSPMSVSEWVSGLSNQAPHLFEISTGSNAKATNSASGSGVVRGAIRKDDAKSFLANLDKIAKNQVRVVS